MKHQTQRGETFKNGCVSHLKMFPPEILWVNTVKAGQAVSNMNSKKKLRNISRVLMVKSQT